MFLEKYLQVLMAVLPGILLDLDKIPDPRDPKKIKHRLTVVLFYGIVIFALGFDSRRDANRNGTSVSILEIFRSVFPQLNSSPHMDTVARLLEALSVKDIVRVHMNEVKKLIRNKKFRRLIVDGCYVVAVDGTQKWSGTWMFDPRLLTRTHRDGHVTYHVYVVEASLVGPQGIYIPLISEFCENDPDMGEQTKQDCELKAFYRLAGRLKSLFPRQRLLIVADGLYPKGPVMELCITNGWDFMMVLPNSVLYRVWKMARAIRDGKTRDAQPNQRLVNEWGDHRQEFWWANRIVYTWKAPDGTSHHTLVHVVVCHETWQEEESKHTGRKKGLQGVLVTKERTWAWISAKPITSKNVLERCNDAGRARWNIEEGILTEKKRGYNYEHMFSYDWNGMQCWHVLMHLGHLINILVIHSKELWETAKRKGIKGLWDILKDCVRGNWADTSKLANLPANPRLVLVI